MDNAEKLAERIATLITRILSPDTPAADRLAAVEEFWVLMVDYVAERLPMKYKAQLTEDQIRDIALSVGRALTERLAKGRLYYEGWGKFQRLIARCMRHEALDVLKRIPKYPPTSFDNVAYKEQAAPDTAMERLELEMLFNAQAERAHLTDQERTVLGRFALDDWSAPEIALHLGVGRARVYQILNEAKKKMREIDW